MQFGLALFGSESLSGNNENARQGLFGKWYLNPIHASASLGIMVLKRKREHKCNKRMQRIAKSTACLCGRFAYITKQSVLCATADTGVKAQVRSVNGINLHTNSVYK